jgi:cytochrome c
MKRLNIVVVGLAVLVASGSNLFAAGGDAVRGEAVFKKCMTCHRIGEGAKIAIGPVLNNVIGRQSGTYPGFSYSPLNKAAGENGLIWNEDRIFAYLPDPNAFLKKFLTDAGKPELATGSTKMTFKLEDEQQRLDVIAYIKKFSPPAAATPAPK